PVATRSSLMIRDRPVVKSFPVACSMIHGENSSAATDRAATVGIAAPITRANVNSDFNKSTAGCPRRVMMIFPAPNKIEKISRAAAYQPSESHIEPTVDAGSVEIADV